MHLKYLSATIIAALLSGCGGSDDGENKKPVTPPIEEPIPPIEEPVPPIEEPIVPPEPDADNDGLSDDVEIANGLNPNDPSDGYYADNDNDLIVNGLEIAYNLDLRNPIDSLMDNDNDGLSNLDELFIKTTILEYTANTDGPLFEVPNWNVYQTNSNISYDLIERNGEKFQTLRDDATNRNPYFRNGMRINSYIDYLFLEGGEYSFDLAFYGNGGFFSFEIPAEDNPLDIRLLMGVSFAPTGEDGKDLSFSIRDHSTVVVPNVYTDEIHKVRYVFDGGKSFSGSIYVDDFKIAKLENLFTSNGSIGTGISLSSGSTGGVGRGFDLSKLRLSIGDMKVTDPNNDDSDEDGLTDKEEVENGLNPNDEKEGSNSDTDGDGVSNRDEIDHGFNPTDSEDMIDVDSDGDGFTNEEEIEVGFDPFTPNTPSDDSDNDGLTNEIEFEYILNPNDPNDGYSADTDGDGVSNGDEILNGTNPNDHMLKVKDELTVLIPVIDTNGDGVVNDKDQKKSVKLNRYSLRKDSAEVWLFNENNEDKYLKMDVVPEVRAFRGRIEDIHDGSVFATIWPDCTISYDVFLGYTAKPDYMLSADSNYYNAYNYSFDYGDDCKTTGISDARYQRGLVANFENVPYSAEELNPDKNYWPSQGDEFHLFERPQSHQSSYYAFNQGYSGGKNIEQMVALMEYQANLADQFTTRSFFERISVTDLLVELSGSGETDEFGNIIDGSVGSDWDDNWSAIRSEFWGPRRSGNYWYEHVYWNKPSGSTGVTYGERMQNSPSQSNQGTFTHEMGHNYGSGHESFGERFNGINAMRSIHSTTHSTIIHQGEAIERRFGSLRSGVRMHEDLRVPASDWNIHPLAQPDHASVYRDEFVNIDVLSNDSDPNNEKLNVQAVYINSDLSSYGVEESIISVNPDNTIYFEPPKGFVGLVDAYYILSDEAGYTTRGILHINVEHNGISDVFTFDQDSCKEVRNNISGFDGTSGDSGIALWNWGYKKPRYGPSGEAYEVNCDTRNITQGITSNIEDNSVTWSAMQMPFYSGQIRNITDSKDYYHPHLYEINDKDFSISFWHKPDASKDLSTYSELARRGRTSISGWDVDGWVVSSTGDTLMIQIHEKSKLAKNSVLQLQVPNIAGLMNSTEWVHIGMTLDWAEKDLIAFIDGQKVGEMKIPDNFELISTSGTGHTYGRGAFAVFGQGTLNEAGVYTMSENSGVDDVVIAHKALSEIDMLALYNKELPAFSPMPKNGKSVDINSLSSLNWKTHSNMNLQVKRYDVYLSTDKSLVEARDNLVAVNPILILGQSVDISGLGLSSIDVYYWKVDAILQDDTRIDGETWSIWESSNAAPMSLLRINTTKKELVVPEQGPYNGDIQLDDDYEYHPNNNGSLKTVPGYDMSYIEHYQNNHN